MLNPPEMREHFRGLIEGHHLARDAGELERTAAEIALGAVEELLHLAVAASDAREREASTLPDVVVVHLRHRGAEAPLQLRLRREELLALALEGVVLGEVELDREDADVPGAHARILGPMPSRPSARAALAAGAVLAGGLWALAAVLLWRSRIPGDLELPRLGETAFFHPQATGRAENYERVVVWVLVGSVVAQVAVLAAMAWRLPRTARAIGLGPIGSGVIVGLLTMLAAWAADIPFTAVLTWWDRRHDLSEEGYVEAVIGPYAELFGLTVTSLVTIVVVMWLARKLLRLWWLPR